MASVVVGCLIGLVINYAFRKIALAFYPSPCPGPSKRTAKPTATKSSNFVCCEWTGAAPRRGDCPDFCGVPRNWVWYNGLSPLPLQCGYSTPFVLGTPLIRGIGTPSHPQCPRRRLENAFGDVMAVAAVGDEDVTLPRTFTAKACQKSATNSLSNSPILAAGNFDLEDESTAARQDRSAAGGQRLVHRHMERP